MKKIILVMILGTMFVSGTPVKAKRCSPIEASRANAGRILDWCRNVTCRKCVDVDENGGATIYTTECWANC